jgi:hypothetical protein
MGMVATSVLPSPVAISVIFPECCHPADELHVEWNHFPNSGMLANNDFRFALDHPAAGVFHGGECLGQNLIEPQRQLLVVRDFGKLVLPRGGFLAQFVVGELLKSGFDFIDAADDRPEFFQLAVIPRPEDHFYQPNHDDLRQFAKITRGTLREEPQNVKANRCDLAPFPGGIRRILWVGRDAAARASASVASAMRPCLCAGCLRELVLACRTRPFFPRSTTSNPVLASFG